MAEKPEATAEDLKKATEETLQAAQKLGEVVYKQSSSATPPTGEAGATGDTANGETDKKQNKGEAEEGEVVKD